MDNRSITPDMARRELARRELARRGVSLNPDAQQQPESQQSPGGFGKPPEGESFSDMLKSSAESPAVQGVLGMGDEIAKLLSAGYVSPESGSGTSYNVGKFAGQVAPYMAAEPLVAGSKILAGASPFVRALLSGGMTSAGESALLSPDQSVEGRLKSGAIGGAVGGGLGGLSHGIMTGLAEGLEKLRPSKMFRGELSPKELEKNLFITKGTETGLGDVIGSPFLKRQLENVLTRTPFSDAPESLARTGKQVVSRGEGILSNMLGHENPHEVPKKITDVLTDQFEKHELDKSKHYTKFNELADKSNLKLNLPSFSEQAKKFSNAIKSSDLLKNDPDAASLLRRLENYKNPVSETGRLGADSLPVKKYPSAKEALLLKGKLNKLSNQYGVSSIASERGLSKVFGKLASSLSSDIKETIRDSGKPELMNALNVAEEDYAKNFSPFLDKEIYKYVSGDKNPETIITNFIKTSPSTDLAENLEKLSSKLPEKEKSLLGYAYFSRALDNEGNLNPAKMGTAIEKLGHNQFKSLVPDPLMRNRLKDYSKFQHMNKEAQDLMFNPKTGQRNTDALMTGLLSVLGGGATGGIGALGAPGAAILAGRKATKALTSPELRERLVREMIKNQPKFDKLKQRGAGSTLSEGVLNAMMRNEE